MNAADTSHYLENQFLNATRFSRKRCKMLADDHHAKLAARAPLSAPVAALQALWLPVYALWNTAYNNWQNARAAYRSTTQMMENLQATLQVTPPGGGRSKLDEWEGRVAGLWGQADPFYQHFFPQGREPFTRQGRDAIISEVLNLSSRMAGKTGELAAATSEIQSQVDVLNAVSAPVPESLTDALTLATERQGTINLLASRISTFHGQMLSARTNQQGREGDRDTAALEADKQRVRICRRMYANMGALIALHTELDSPEAEPQLKVAEYFQFELLSLTTPEEEPEPEPPPPPPP